MTAPLTPEALVQALVTCLAENDHRSRYRQALALLAGPLVPIITDAAEARAAHQQVTAERDEARAEYERGLEHRNDLMDRVVDLKTSLAAAKSREDAATSELARLRAEGEAKDRALKEIEDRSQCWTMRDRITPDDVVVRDDGQHFKVLALNEIGRIARAARAAMAREG